MKLVNHTVVHAPTVYEDSEIEGQHYIRMETDYMPLWYKAVVEDSSALIGWALVMDQTLYADLEEAHKMATLSKDDEEGGEKKT